MTWSVERLFCDVARLAKAVVAPAFTPPVDCWPRTDAYRASLDGADQLADAEAEQEVWEPPHATFAEIQERLWEEREAEEKVAERLGDQTSPADAAIPGGSDAASAAGDRPLSGCRRNPPSPPPAEGHPTWEGWAAPAICEVLAEHHPIAARGNRVGCRHGELLFGLADEHAWREHVAPIIAERIACDPARAIAALQTSHPTQ